ncbi:carbohydrate binding domain-containing protein [candidate division KSB1 bacterium]|nr:carbohydrate binding domain-containing protein [candidate division KSB1 bacterium]
MRATVYILFLSCEIIFGQNLIQNPGFENGFSGWGSLWTRTADAGRAETVNQPVHGGTRALHIEHWGEQDWSLGPNDRFPVQPGYIFEFSAWARVTQMPGWSYLCITTLDENQNYTDWSYQIKDLTVTGDKYEQYTLRFVVQENVSYIWPRFVGGGEGDFYFDDVYFALVDSLDSGKIYNIDNGELLVEVDSGDFGILVTDRAENRTYQMMPSPQLAVQEVSATSVSLQLFCRYIPGIFDLQIDIELIGRMLKFIMSADGESELSEVLRFPGEISSRENDYLIVPRASGMILPVTQQFPFWDFPLWGYKATMAFIGVTNFQNGYMIISENPWDTGFAFPQNSATNLTNVRLYHAPSKGRFGYDRTFYYTFVGEDSYVDMCRMYRSLQNTKSTFKTFAQKFAENPNIAKLAGAVDFWALHGQFRTKSFIDSLYNYGIDRAIYSLGGGWYNPNDYSDLIQYIHSKGWLSSRYDIYTDVWPPDHPEAPWYRTDGYPEDVIIDADGSLRKGWLAYIDGNIPFQGYYTCSATHGDYAYLWIEEDLAKNPYNCRFIDVELASSLFECYSPIHPTTRAQDATHRNELLGIVKNDFGLVTGAEEARDFAFANVDYGEGTMTISAAENAGYDWSTPTDQPGESFLYYNVNPASRLPLHQLVYHDVHVATWYTGDGQSKVPDYWDVKDLLNILYASMPLFLPPDPDYFIRHREKFLTSYHLVSSVFRRAGFAPLKNHRFLTADRLVQLTEFNNGWQIVVNFSDQNFTWLNKILPPKGFYAVNGEEAVYRINFSDGQIDVARLSDRLFVNPHDRLVFYNGVRTGGPVLFLKKETGIHVAFIGNQSAVDFSPSECPWPLDSVQVINNDTQKIQQPELLTDGWIRIKRSEKHRFYTISGRFLNTSVQNRKMSDTGMHLDNFFIYPNPANSNICIEYELCSHEKVILAIYNILGEKVATFVNADQSPGIYRYNFKGKNFSSGLYFCRLSTPRKTILKKLTLLK